MFREFFTFLLSIIVIIFISFIISIVTMKDLNLADGLSILASYPIRV